MANEYNIYGGQDGVIDYGTVLATMDLADESVSITKDLPAGTIWEFVRRRKAADCALESPDSPSCEVRIDGAGEMILDTPNLPQGLVAIAEADGDILLRWRYCMAGQEVVPTGFKVYIDTGSGFNFAAPSYTVVYSTASNGEFSKTVTGLTPGQRYKFCVRAYTTAKGETQNTGFVTAVPVNTGPSAATVTMAVVEEES